MKIKIVTTPNIAIPVAINQTNSLEMMIPPYGPACLASYLRQRGHQVQLQDVSSRVGELAEVPGLPHTDGILKRVGDYLIRGTRDDAVDAFAEQIFRHVYADGLDLVGISVLSRCSFFSALLLAKKIKEKTVTPVVLGGALMTEYGVNRTRITKLMETFKFIDYIVCGDGEVPLLGLLEQIRGVTAARDVPGLSYRDNGGIKVNERFFSDIEAMPIPDWDGLPMELYHSGEGLQLVYQVTRGCPQKCSFCAYHLIDTRVMFKSHNKVLSELAALRDKYKARYFFFCDSNLSVSYDYLQELCGLMVKNELNISWFVSASVKNMDRKLLDNMRKAGCYYVTWGIESGSDKVLRLMNKGFSSAQAANVLKDAHSLGIYNMVNLITGFPGENDEDLELTRSFIRQNAEFIGHVKVADFGLIPGTPMHEHPAEYGLQNVHADRRSAIGLGRLGYDEINGPVWKEILVRNKRANQIINQEAMQFLRNKAAMKAKIGGTKQIRNFFG